MELDRSRLRLCARCAAKIIPLLYISSKISISRPSFHLTIEIFHEMYKRGTVLAA